MEDLFFLYYSLFIQPFALSKFVPYLQDRDQDYKRDVDDGIGGKKRKYGNMYPSRVFFQASLNLEMPLEEVKKTSKGHKGKEKE